MSFVLRLLVTSMQSICLVGVEGENMVDSRLQDTIFIQHTFGGRLMSKVLDHLEVNPNFAASEIYLLLYIGMLSSGKFCCTNLVIIRLNVCDVIMSQCDMKT